MKRKEHWQRLLLRLGQEGFDSHSCLYYSRNRRNHGRA
nr:MAG TPA: hypothetical protein [Caudoviricetes sp.]